MPRPSLYPVRFELRLAKSQIKKLEEISKSENETVSNIIRIAINAYWIEK